MGAYLYFKLVNPDKAGEVNDFVEPLEEQQILKEKTEGYLPVFFWDERDIKAEKEKENGTPDFFDKGEGNIKTSACPNYAEYRHFVAEIFEKIHERFDIKVLSGSCSLSEHYFTPEQIKTITNDGEALSGDDKKRIRKIMEE